MSAAFRQESKEKNKRKAEQAKKRKAEEAERQLAHEGPDLPAADPASTEPASGDYSEPLSTLMTDTSLRCYQATLYGPLSTSCLNSRTRHCHKVHDSPRGFGRLSVSAENLGSSTRWKSKLHSTTFRPQV